MIVFRLREERSRLMHVFSQPGQIRCCWLDNLLPQDMLDETLAGLPQLSQMVRRRSRKERKYVSCEIGRLGEATRNLVHAFCRQEIADTVAPLMVPQLDIDPHLYNGGITIMTPGDFMCPPDNTHNYERTQLRAVALLYYISPVWRDDYGGALELWNEDCRMVPRRIAASSNRLVIMEIKDNGWHSVQPIVGPERRISITTHFYLPKIETATPRLTRYAPWPGARSSHA